jgi:hypothetical protein
MKNLDVDVKTKTLGRILYEELTTKTLGRV